MNYATDTELDEQLQELFVSFRELPDPSLEELALAFYRTSDVARRRRRDTGAWLRRAATGLWNLGSIRMSLGTAKGAWGRARATLQEAGAVQIQVRDQDGVLEAEEWIDTDGFVRDAGYQDGRLSHLAVRGAHIIDYDIVGKLAREYAVPPNAAENNLLAGLRQALATLQTNPGLSIIERRATSLRTGVYHIVEISGVIDGRTLNLLGMEYETGDRIRLRMRLAPDTGRIHFLEQQRLDTAGMLQGSSYASFQWQVEQSAELRTIAYSADTVVIRDTWWDEAAQEQPHQPFSDPELEQSLGEIPRLTPSTRLLAVGEMKTAHRVYLQQARLRVKRLVFGSALAALLIVSLGFINFPLGPAQGAWAQALSAAREIAALHLQVRDQNGQLEHDEWIGEDGFKREAEYQGGRLTNLHLRNTNSVYYYPNLKLAKENSFVPGSLLAQDVDSFTESTFKVLAEVLAASPQLQLQERRVGRLWGGVYDEVQLAGIVNRDFYLGNTNYLPGDKVSFILKTDPASGRLLSMEQYKLDSAGTVLEAKFASVEWEVEAPAGLRSFTYPRGTKVVRDTLWGERTNQSLATATSRYWQVTLHSLEANRSGDLYLTISRQKLPGITLIETPVVLNFAVWAQDSLGASYRQAPERKVSGDYEVVKLVRQTPGPAPQRLTVTVSVTVDPNPAAEPELLTFRNLPLPARGDYTDLSEVTTQTLQY